EPARLVVGGSDGELERGAFLVPDAGVVAALDAEPVRARVQVGVERLAPRADVLPVAVAAFEHDAEVVLLGSNEAQPGVVDLQVANMWRQPQAGCRVIRLAVGGDLLDDHRRDQRVGGKAMRIDDADPAQRQEPDLAVTGFGDDLAVAVTELLAPHSVGAVEDRRVNRRLWIGGPRVQLGPGRAQQATGHVQPDRIGVAFHHPVSRIARKSVPGGERERATIFESAQAFLGSGPEGAFGVDVEAAESFAGCVGRREPTLLEMIHVPVTKFDPQSVLYVVAQQVSGRFSAPELRPRYALDRKSVV